MKMKKAYIYLISFFSLTIMFSICYFLSFKAALNQFNRNAVEKNNLMLSYNESVKNEANENNLGNNNANTDSEMLGTDAVEDNAVAVDTTENEYITPSTKYTLQEYDLKTNSLVKKELNTPEFLIGLTREDVITYVSNYVKDMPLADYEKGLVSFELIAFSKEEVVLRKSYNSDLVQYKYYLAVQDGLITVYYSDKKTVFEYTDIEVGSLSEEEQIELNHGKYIKDSEELYGILESYSS